MTDPTYNLVIIGAGPTGLAAAIYAAREGVPALASALRSRADLRFNFLADITAVDFPPVKPPFELVYMLVSIVLLQRMRLKVRLHWTDAHIATVS